MKEKKSPKPPKGFRVHSELFKSALKKVMPVANSKANVLPIVNGNVKVSVTGSEATLTATDLTTTISVKMPVHGLTNEIIIDPPIEEQPEMLMLPEGNEDMPGEDFDISDEEFENNQYDDFLDEPSYFEAEEPKQPRYKRKSKKEAEVVVEVLEAEPEQEPIPEEQFHQTEETPFEDHNTEGLPEWMYTTPSEEMEEEETIDDDEDMCDDFSPINQQPFTEKQEDESTFETDIADYEFLLPIESLPVIEALNCPIEVVSYDGVITITTDIGSKYRFLSDPVEDYPNRRKILMPDFKFYLPSEILFKTVKGVSFAVGDDNLRPAMTGIYVEKATNESIRLVATNAHILLYKTIDAKPVILNENEDEKFDPSAIMPPIAFKLLAGTTGLVSIACDLKNRLLEFDVAGVKVRCGFVEGTYPAYKSVIPNTEPPLTVTVGKSQMLSTLKRAKTLCDEATNRLIIVVHQNEMKLICNKQLDDGPLFTTMDETLKVRTEVAKTETEFPQMVIGVNANLFYDIILQGSTTDTLVFGFYSPDKAIMINSTEIETALIMPVMIR